MTNRKKQSIDLETVISLLPGHVYWLDRNNVFLGCNDLQARTIGLSSRHEIVGRTISEFQTKENAEHILKINNKIMETGKPQIAEEPYLRSDGKTVIFLSEKVPIKDEEGMVIGLLGISLDISHFKEKETELALVNKQTQLVLKNVMSSFPGHVYWKNNTGVYLGCNDAQAKSLGFESPQKVVGKTDYDLSPKDLADVYKEIDSRIMQTGQKETLEEKASYYGKPATFLSTKMPLLDEEGRKEGLLGISIDITERKQAEEETLKAKEKAEAADKAKTEFLDNMRHSIRTPASGIVGFSHIIKEEAKEPNVKEYADNLIASGNALLNFLDEIMDTISVSTGEVPLMRKKFELKEEVTKIIDLSKAKAREKKLELSLFYDDLIPKHLLGDPKRIQRVLLELISNALKFTHQGHVKVTVSLAKKNGHENVVKLEVEDTGIGVPEEKQEEIFLRFKRLTPAYQGIYKGAGLGLSIVKQFMDELHGEIKVKSGKEGSTFTCIIPLEEPLLSEQEEQTTPQESTIRSITTTEKTQQESFTQPRKAKAKSKILVVEDDAGSAEVAQLVLGLLDCEVDVAVNGEMALKLFQSKPYDLIFMDIGLPDMDGYQVTKRIRALEWKNEYHIPIIALSAHTTIEHKQSCIEKGMTAVLVKPLQKEKATDILNAFIPARIKKEAPSKPQPKEESQDQLFVIKGRFIDLEVAKEIGFPPKTLEEKIFPLLLKSIPKDISQLREAYQKGDWKGVEDLAHKLKGGAGYCGAVRMKEACSRLEVYLADGEGKAGILKQLYELALKETDAAKKEIEGILNKSNKKKKEGKAA